MQKCLIMMGGIMRFIYDPIKFVKENASTLSILKLLLCLDLGGTPKAGQLATELVSQQKSDGSWPISSNLDVGSPTITWQSTSLLLDTGFSADSQPIASALDYYRRTQREDGGWCEDKAVKIPKWMTWRTNSNSISYYTAQALILMDRVGLRNSDMFQRAEKWLRSIQEEDGQFRYWVGGNVDWDATTGILFNTFRDLFGEDDSVFVRGKPRYEEYLSSHAEDARRGYRYFGKERKDNDIYHLTFLLTESTARAGYTIEDKRVKAIVRAIYQTQRPDGGWKFWEDKSDPTYSVDALRSLVWVGDLKKNELTEMFHRHDIIQHPNPIR